jgi:transposase
MMMSGDDPNTSVIQRFEVFTGAGKRREWPPEVKAAIVAESCAGLESVSAVARRHGLAVTQLFGWRRQLRKQLEDQGLTMPTAAPSFVPAVIEQAPSGDPPAEVRPPRRRRSPATPVELEIDGVAVKIGRGADAGIIAAVIEALKATR